MKDRIRINFSEFLADTIGWSHAKIGAKMLKIMRRPTARADAIRKGWIADHVNRL